jgi:hypothetical protein
MEAPLPETVDELNQLGKIRRANVQMELEPGITGDLVPIYSSYNLVIEISDESRDRFEEWVELYGPSVDEIDPGVFRVQQ